MKTCEAQKLQLNYLHPHCNCSSSSLQWAALRLGPAFVYDLYVHTSLQLEIRTMLRQLCADVKDNPLAPYVNLHPDDSLDPDEWYLVANGIAWGSVGVR